MKIKQLSYMLMGLFLSACLTDDLSQSPLELVVEGWIDNDEYPVVIVTTTVPVSEEVQKTDELGDYILRWAKVTVSDGEQEVVLTGKYDRRYFPPYIYTTSRLKGQVGRTYHLTVDYKDFHAEATTTIPPAPHLDSLRLHTCAVSDTLYELHAYFSDDLAEQRYYKFFTCNGTQSRMFLSSYMQTLSNEVFTPGQEQDISVYKGRLVTAPDSYIPYFQQSDTILVKFARMDRRSFDMWDQLEHNMTLGHLPITAAKTTPHFNVQGGLGYWCGYGSTVYPVVVADSLSAQP